MFLLAGAGVAAWLPLGRGHCGLLEQEGACRLDQRGDRPPDHQVAVGQTGQGAIRRRGRALGEMMPDTPAARQTRGGGYPGGGTGPGGGYPAAARVRAADTPAVRGAPAAASAFPGIGGISIPGLGGKGAAGGGAVSPYEGTVRWESARPILEAMKSPLPEAFEGRYVISVSGIPLLRDRSMGAGEEDDSTASRRREQDDIDRLKGLSSLEARGRDPVQAGLVTRQVAPDRAFSSGFPGSCCRWRRAIRISCSPPIGPPRGQGPFSAERDAVPWRVSGVGIVGFRSPVPGRATIHYPHDTFTWSLRAVRRFRLRAKPRLRITHLHLQ